MLRPFSTSDEVKQLCREALRFEFAAVCILPHHVSVASQLLRHTSVHTCSVISFPYGADAISTKIVSMHTAISHGADEVDVEVNLSELATGNQEYVRNEMLTLSQSLAMIPTATGHRPLLKMIIETYFLTDDLKRLLCRYGEEAGVDFIKTSTGTAPLGATVADVALLRSSLNPRVRVKASGGIRTLEAAQQMISAGADRIGTSSSIAIMNEACHRSDNR
jgi:deoxyribose-phosphate aldolase